MPVPDSPRSAPLVSLELRWFLPEGLPAAVERWFHEALPGAEIGRPEERVDTYLVVPGQDAVGVKARDGTLEIKCREWARRYEGHAVLGQAERWLKYSWADPRGPGPFDLLPRAASGGPWVTVRKKRVQRKYGWDVGRFVAAPTTAVLDLGVGVEITALEVEAGRWGTVLLEAYAPNADGQAELLDHAVESLWIGYPSPRPGMDRSFGYPRWLDHALGLRGGPALQE